ncbi:MAG: hypothetical protein QMC67_10530 [Candidatus Wallbacteria bacterium]
MLEKLFKLRLIFIMTVLISFVSSVLIPLDQAAAAAIGKRKKGVSKKGKAAVAASAKSAAKFNAPALSAAAKSPASAKTLKKKKVKTPTANPDLSSKIRIESSDNGTDPDVSVIEEKAKIKKSAPAYTNSLAAKSTVAPAKRYSEPAAVESEAYTEHSKGNGVYKDSKFKRMFKKYWGDTDSRLKWMPGLYLTIGANSLEDPDMRTRKLWTKLGFIPRFSYDKLSFAYDLTFYFDENNNLRKRDWDDVSDYIRKIYYIYYGGPTDRYQVRIEMLDDITLGSGAIFRNYCGNLRYPLMDKKVGGLFKWNSGYDDTVKLFIDDVASPGIYGISGEIMPHDNLQVGAQYISDNKVNMGLYNDNISVWSAHLAIPIVTKENTKFKIYEEIGSIDGFGKGMHTGIVTEVNDLTFKNEFRIIDSNYIPNYFDTLYEMERHYKGRALLRLRNTGDKYSGWFNEIKLKVNDSYTVRASYEKDYAPNLVPHLSLGVDYTGLEYNKLKLSFNYDRKNIYYSSTPMNGAIYGIKAKYDISDSSCMIYELRHIPDNSARLVDSINIETQLKF